MQRNLFYILQGYVKNFLHLEDLEIIHHPMAGFALGVLKAFMAIITVKRGLSELLIKKEGVRGTLDYFSNHYIILIKDFKEIPVFLRSDKYYPILLYSTIII